MTKDEARLLPPSERKAGIVVEGNATPFGGSWVRDVERDQILRDSLSRLSFVVGWTLAAGSLTLAEPPTAPEE